MKSSNIGGQAVLEGIMMKNETRYAVAVRKPDQADRRFASKNTKACIPWQGVYKVPFIRGIFNFIDSLDAGNENSDLFGQLFRGRRGGSSY